MSIFYVGSYARLPCRQISRMIWQKRGKKSREMPLFLSLFFRSFASIVRRSHLPTRRPVNVERRSHDPNARTTASSALESRTRRTAHTAHSQSTMPHALAATSRPAMMVRAFEIAQARTRDAPRGLSWRGRASSPRGAFPGVRARVTRCAPSLFRVRAPERRGRASREPACAGRGRPTLRGPNLRHLFLTAERRQPPRPAGFSRRSGSDRDPPNVQYRRRFVPRARPRPSRRPPRALARSEARAPASPPAHQVRNNRVLFPAGQWRERVATTEERTRGVSSLDTGCYDSKRSHLHPNPPRTGTAGFARARTVVKVRPAGNRSLRRADASRLRAEKLHAASVQIGPPMQRRFERVAVDRGLTSDGRAEIFPERRFRRRAVSSDPIAIFNTHTRDETIDRLAARSS